MSSRTPPHHSDADALTKVVELDPIEKRWLLIVMKLSGPRDRLQSRSLPTSVMPATPIVVPCLDSA